MQEMDQTETEERADGVWERKRPTCRYWITERWIFETPDGRIGTGWNEGRFVYASFAPDFVQGDGEKIRPERVFLSPPNLCFFSQLDAVDGNELFDAVSRAAKEKKEETKVDLYDYVRESMNFPKDVGEQTPNCQTPGSCWPSISRRDDQSIREYIKQKRPEVVITALAYLKTPITGLTDKAGNPIVGEYEPTEDESREALKQYLDILLDAVFDCGYGGVGSTVMNFLEVVLKGIELGRPSEAIADDMVRAVVDSVDANVLTCRKLFWRLEAERMKSLDGSIVLPPSGYDWPYEDGSSVQGARSANPHFFHILYTSESFRPFR